MPLFNTRVLGAATAVVVAKGVDDEAACRECVVGGVEEGSGAGTISMVGTLSVQ